MSTGASQLGKKSIVRMPRKMQRQVNRFLPCKKKVCGRCPKNDSVRVWHARPVPDNTKVNSTISEDDPVIAWRNDWLVTVCRCRVTAVKVALNRERVHEDSSPVPARLLCPPSTVKNAAPNVSWDLTGEPLPGQPPWPMFCDVFDESLVGAGETGDLIRTVTTGATGVHQMLPALLRVGQLSLIPILLMSDL